MQLFCCAACCSFLASEFQQNPQAELLVAQKSFAATVNVLTELQLAGEFKPKQTKRITNLIYQGRDYLSEWDLMLENGEEAPDIATHFRNVLTKLIEYQLMKGGDK